MVKVQVGNEVRDWKEVDVHWLCNAINGRRDDKQPACVRVTVKEGPLDMILSTPGCGGGIGGSRAPNADEGEIISLWNKLHLNEPGFRCGNVQAFLVQLRRLI